MRNTRVPELVDSHDRIEQTFSEIINLLKASKHTGDSFWRSAIRKFNFPEPSWFCLGYGDHGTQGSGWGKQKRVRVIGTVKELVDAGIEDPSLFELVSVFEEYIGSDLVGDMMGHIVEQDLINYSARVLGGFKTDRPKTYFRGHRLPLNIYNRKPVALVPRTILSPLPIARSRDEIADVCDKNEELRNYINQIVAETGLKETLKIKRYLKQAFIEAPERLADVLRYHKSYSISTYDFQEDPTGQISWYFIGKDWASSKPLALILPEQPSIEDLWDIVLRICHQFKRLVEENRLWKVFYLPNGRIRKEEFIQLLFYAIASSYCDANNLDLSREPNAGNGPVDFKLSRGSNEKVLVEVKKSSHSKLIQGFEHQLRAYEAAEDTVRSVYLVISEAESNSKIQQLEEYVAEARIQNNLSPELIVVDASKKESASRRR